MTEPPDWVPGAPDGELAPGAIHVWLAHLDDVPGDPFVSASVMSAEERARARRFAFDRDRRRFSAARVLLRTLLARYVGADPADLRFAIGPHGKPSLAGSPSAPDFNVSHSRDAAVIAISRAGEVGVDIEAIRPMDDGEGIAGRFFAPAEAGRLRAVPPELRDQAFFACWTRKEAFVKAIGEGLSHPLDSFEVTLAPGEPARLLHVGGHPPDPAHWMLAALPAVAGYAGALVVRGRPERVDYRRWGGNGASRSFADSTSRCVPS
jgi:4'-phosphopantetheinyl transferase